MYLEVEFRRVACRSCGLVKQEKLTWIADNPLYTKRFAFFVGRRCRASTVKDVAKELHLDWQTVKSLRCNTCASNSVARECQDRW